MPRALAVPMRETIVSRHEQGVPLRQVAADLHLSWWTVRKLWRRYQRLGTAGLAPAYDRCGRRGPRGARLPYRATRWLRRRHPTWGAGLIRATLARKWPTVALPHVRTIQRWLQQAGLTRPRRRRPATRRARATTAHAVWQVDAVERVALADAQRVSWLSATDEASGSVLDPVVFPPGRLASGAGGGRATGCAWITAIPGALPVWAGCRRT
jgi:transposase